MTIFKSEKTKRRVKKSLKITLICFLVLAGIIFSDLTIYGDPFERFLYAVTRTGTADEIPSCSGNITDIRVTVRDRSYFCSVDAFVSHVFYGTQIKQIYYGYYVDGKWYDYPAENYQLKPFFGNGDNIQDTALRTHCVRIGPYLLIAYTTPGASDVLGVMYDTLNSPVYHITEYGTFEPFDGANCSRIIDPIGGEYCSVNTNLFNNWHYIIIKYDSLSEDYHVTLDRYVLYDGVEEVDEADLHTMVGMDGKSGLYKHTLSETHTYDDIQYSLARGSD